MKDSFVKYLYQVCPYPVGIDLNSVPYPVACGDFTSMCEFVSEHKVSDTFFSVLRSDIVSSVNFMLRLEGDDCIFEACRILECLEKEVI